MSFGSWGGSKDWVSADWEEVEGVGEFMIELIRVRDHRVS